MLVLGGHSRYALHTLASYFKNMHFWVFGLCHGAFAEFSVGARKKKRMLLGECSELRKNGTAPARERQSLFACSILARSVCFFARVCVKRPPYLAEVQGVRLTCILQKYRAITLERHASTGFFATQTLPENKSRKFPRKEGAKIKPNFRKIKVSGKEKFIAYLQPHAFSSILFSKVGFLGCLQKWKAKKFIEWKLPCRTRRKR
ncbi:uncharacterized protein NEMAJ01_0745 [Nematocida major]|uniref:uncharacterized protein n=1 Tax=Nematocida major TaxID=1912982 RepID=UPI0020086C36|nr:uncharacterized protein NEMAJ01_0745 [Nematocida major]KAH9385849.1 hypothetical protein NEMAJ01_0745 [Nematocida major]